MPLETWLSWYELTMTHCYTFVTNSCNHGLQGPLVHFAVSMANVVNLLVRLSGCFRYFVCERWTVYQYNPHSNSICEGMHQWWQILCVHSCTATLLTILLKHMGLLFMPWQLLCMTCVTGSQTHFIVHMDLGYISYCWLAGNRILAWVSWKWQSPLSKKEAMSVWLCSHQTSFVGCAWPDKVESKNFRSIYNWLSVHVIENVCITLHLGVIEHIDIQKILSYYWQFHTPLWRYIIGISEDHSVFK